MKHLLWAGVLTIGTVFGGMTSAATLGLITEEPILEASDVDLDYIEIDFGGTPDPDEADLSGFGAPITSDMGLVSPLVDPASLEISLFYDLLDPVGTAAGSVIVTDDFTFDELLAGDVVAVGFEDGLLELELGFLSGSLAPEFGAGALVEIFFGTGFGDPFDTFVDGDFLLASAKISAIAPIPLPAGGALLATALVAAAGLRRRQKAPAA